MKQKTYVMVKPDFANNPEVIKMLKNKILNTGFEILVEGFVQYNVQASRAHYSDHVEKPFYPALENYITSDVAYGMIVAGENVIDIIHSAEFMGSTRDPKENTIRYEGLKLMGYLERDPLINGRENVAHSSDSIEAAEKESAIFIDLLKNEIQKSNDDKIEEKTK